MKTDTGFSLSDLEIQKVGLEDRIKRLEADLRAPLEPKFNEQSGQVSNQLILTRILEAERGTLRKLNFEINRLTSQGI